MIPVSPVMPGSEPIEVLYANEQPQYVPLPAVYVDNENSRTVISRWRLTEEERSMIANGADVTMQLLLGPNQLLTPSNLQIVMPNESPALIEGF